MKPYRIPAALLVCTIVGLLLALVKDGALDSLAVVILAVPIFVALRALLSRPEQD